MAHVKKLTKAQLHRAAQEFGRRGGKKGGPARAAKMTPEERRQSALHAITIRWSRYRAEKEAG